MRILNFGITPETAIEDVEADFGITPETAIKDVENETAF